MRYKSLLTFWKVQSGKGGFFQLSATRKHPQKKQQQQHTTVCSLHNRNKEARMRGTGERGANPEKLRPRGVGLRRVVGRRKKCLPVEIRWYRQVLSRLIEVKRLQSIVKKLFTCWKVKTLQKREERGANNSNKQQNQGQHKQPETKSRKVPRRSFTRQSESPNMLCCCLYNLLLPLLRFFLSC